MKYILISIHKYYYKNQICNIYISLFLSLFKSDNDTYNTTNLSLG